MHLKKWLDINGLTYQEFADRIGTHRQTIVNLMAGKDIRLSMAARIEDATLGVVKCRELWLHETDAKSNTKENENQDQDKGALNQPVGTANAA
jgi:plasmid maintenance system antidote protein VapI